MVNIKLFLVMIFFKMLFTPLESKTHKFIIFKLLRLQIDLKIQKNNVIINSLIINY